MELTDRPDFCRTSSVQCSGGAVYSTRELLTYGAGSRVAIDGSGHHGGVPERVVTESHLERTRCPLQVVARLDLVQSDAAQRSSAIDGRTVTVPRPRAWSRSGCYLGDLGHLAFDRVRADRTLLLLREQVGIKVAAVAQRQGSSVATVDQNAEVGHRCTGSGATVITTKMPGTPRLATGMWSRWRGVMVTRA